LDPVKHDFGRYWKHKLQEPIVYNQKAFDIAMMDGYTLHEAAVNYTNIPIYRHFLRITYTPRRFVGLQSGINPMYPFKWPRLATAAADQWNANLGGGGRPAESSNYKTKGRKKPSTPPRNVNEIAMALQLGFFFLIYILFICISTYIFSFLIFIDIFINIIRIINIRYIILILFTLSYIRYF
jgi:hypothetical protein